MEERRRARRTRVLKDAKIFFIGHSLGVDCVVHNLTNSGACLHVARTNDVPANFLLTFDGGRTRRACRRVWSREGRLGASFETSSTQSAKPRQFENCVLDDRSLEKTRIASTGL